MARIPQRELERLKRETDLEELVRASGVGLKAHGKDLLGLCPFHDDKEPSLVVTPAKNLWNCLGACGEGGTVIDWVMRTQGVSFRHAVEILRNGSAVSGVTPAPLKRSTVPRLPCPLSEGAEESELVGQVVDYYHETLLTSPEATAYLEKRGIWDEDAVRIFKLGFANRTLGLRLPERNRATGAKLRERLVETGLYRKSGHEHFNGSLVIPVHDAEGRIVEVYGRKITSKLRKGTALHLYLPGPHRGVWNLDALRTSKEIILCEALVDALTFWCAGYQNVTSAYGTNGFTEEMLEAFKAYGVERVLIAFDRDEAGDAAASKLAERLGSEDISCFRVRFPKGMDVNDYAVRVTPAEKSLGVLLRSAEHMAGPAAILDGSAQPADPMPPSVITEEEGLLPLAAASSPEDVVMCEEIPGSVAHEAAKEEKALDSPPLPADVQVDVREHEVVLEPGGRRWRVRGLERNTSFERLRVNLLVAAGDLFHVDSLDLYSARQRGLFLKQAAVELEVKRETLAKELGRVLLKLEEIQEERIRKTLEPEEKGKELTEEDRSAALTMLRDPHLLDRIAEDLATCGLVGEDTNKLTAYLATVSRKLAKPLAVMVQSSSAAGKSALMDAVLAFVPEEDRVQYSAMTGQSLFYMGETDLKQKVLAISEEEGAEKASYALKLLQSEGKLSIASTGKDPASGRLVTHEYHVDGPAAILLTTTAIDLDEELLNRCIVLAVDESREQTRAIHERQRADRTLEGLERRLAKQDLLKLHQNAQRLLKPLHVVNPFADRLTFLDDTTRTRRDHEKYLALIDAVTLLHQHQREVKVGVVRGRRVDYVETTLDDIAVAIRLAAEALGRSLDELPPQTRRLLELTHSWVRSQCEELALEQSAFLFSRRQLLDATGWRLTQLRVHLARLVEMEYLLVHRGARGLAFVYELLWQGEGLNGHRFVLGLLDTTTISNLAGSKRGNGGRVAAGWRGDASAAAKGDSSDFDHKELRNAHRPSEKTPPSYSSPGRRAVALSAAAQGE
jgi:DNA primase catalytic core